MLNRYVTLRCLTSADFGAGSVAYAPAQLSAQPGSRAELREKPRSPLTSTLVPSYSALCRPAFIPALRLSQRFLLWVFGTVLGFACIRCAGSKPFWPLALVSQALPAIILAALRRFRGAALFHGPPPSPRLGASFWPSGLTLRSSGPAFCGPLTLSVRAH